MTTIKEMREKQQKLVADAREQLEAITDETPAERAAELESRYDEIMAEHDRIDARAQREEKLERAKRAAEDRSEEPALPEPEERRRDRREDPAKPEYRAAFEMFLRHGVADMPQEHRQVLKENRAQATDPGSAGGFLTPTEFMNELVIGMKDWGPMLDPGVTRQLVTATGNTMEIPTSDDTDNEGAILGENTQDTEQDMTFGQKVMDAFKYTSKIIRISEELLQDSAVSVEAEVNRAMSERLGRIVNRHLTVGDGDGQPEGIVTAAPMGHEAAASALTFDDVIDLYHSVDPAYRRGPQTAFMFNDSTLKVLRKIKDGEDRFIWQPADARTGAPSSILDQPYAINQVIADVGTGNRSMVFGDMSRFMVRRVREFAIKRLVERYADWYQVGFLGFARFDGKLVDTKAVKHLVHA